MHLRFLTAGESHGPALVAIVEGLPAGLPVSAEPINHQLARRMQGYGRGARMKIEADAIEWMGGVRAGETLGSPVSMRIVNRDWDNWQDVMAAEGQGEIRRRRVTRPRPGHADLVGVLKYDRLDARDILERASARETAARVAAGALARRLLEEFGVEIGSHVVSLGGVRAISFRRTLPIPLNEAADRSEVRMLDSACRGRNAIARIDEAKKPPATRWAARSRSWRAACRSGSAATPTGTGSSTARLAGMSHVDPRGQGRRDRARLRGRAASRLRGARSDRRGSKAAAA